MTAFDSALPPRCVIAMCAAVHTWPAFTQEKRAMQDESAIRGSVRTVHIVSEDGESLTPLTFAHIIFLLLALLLTHVSFVCSQLHQAHTHTACLSTHQMCAADLDAQSVLQKFGKGKPIPAVIEAVSSGASLKATLLPDHYFVNVMLVGIVCPSFNRRPTGQSAAAPAASSTGAAPAAAAEASEPATNGTASKSDS